MDFKRECPKCNKELTYKSKTAFVRAEKLNKNCRSCAHDNMFGENNNFYGKKHTAEAIRKNKETQKGRHHSPNTEFGALPQNRNTRPIYEIWVEKYGQEEADRKITLENIRKSEAMKGEKNPFYGKVPPQGSGNGWSGWYKGWFFRSLRELSYMIKVIEKEDLVWEPGEQKALRITYVRYDGELSSYYADFLLEKNRLIECKPKSLHSSVVVTLKKEAAEKFCSERNWTYELLEPEMLSEEEIFSLHKNGIIKFMDKYEEKFKVRYGT